MIAAINIEMPGRRRGVQLMVALLLSVFSSAQNLVENGGFEDLQYCPNRGLFANELNLLVPPWLAPTYGSPDIYHSCNDTPYQRVSVPWHSITYGIFPTFTSCTAYCTPRSGDSYLGAFSNLSSLSSETFQINLKQQLKPNHKYKAYCYVRLSHCSAFAVDHFGLYFSISPPRKYIANDFQLPDTVVPQIKNKKGIISDTSKWHDIGGIYKAKGGEEWLTIGLMAYKKEDINRIELDSNDQRAFYYYDDVSVEEIPCAAAPDTVCKGDTFLVTTNVPGNVLWSTDRQGNDTFSILSSFTLSLNQPLSLYLFQDSLIDSAHIRIRAPLNINIGNDTSLCEGEVLNLNAYAGSGTYWWNTGTSGAGIGINTPGEYIVSASNGCLSSDTIEVNFYSLPEPRLSDTLICKEENPSFLLYPGSFTGYLWQPSLSTAGTITVESSGYYSVEVTDQNGCKNTAGSQVSEYCPFYFWIPNAFTPKNKDGLNDEFKPQGSQVLEYNMKIYNRLYALLFETDNLETGWDGTYKGSLCADGVYYYIITYKALVNGMIKEERKLNTFHLICSP